MLSGMTRAFPQTYLAAHHNWTFRNRYRDVDKLFNAFDYGHAALYQALHRLERQGCVEAEWGASENNRRARYYSLTPKGRKRLADQTAYWRSYARALDGILRGA